MTALRPDTEAVFHAARDVPDLGRRQEYIGEACAGDEPRIAHVEALAAADSLLDRPAAGGLLAASVQPASKGPE